MNDLMPWKECEQKFIRKVMVDPEKINSVVEMAKKRLRFVRSINVNKENVNFIFEGYYEVIKEILIAIMLKSGLRSQNHQCLFTFFHKKYGQDAEVNVIKQMNFLRNRLNYYGEEIELSYFQENYKSFEKIIKILLGVLK